MLWFVRVRADRSNTTATKANTLLLQNAMPTTNEHSPTLLWIGGTSALTRSYFNAYPEDGKEWILVGLETPPPHWLPTGARYASLDLTKNDRLQEFIQSLPASLAEVVIGIRPALVTSLSDAECEVLNRNMLQGLRHVLEQLLVRCPGLRTVIHLSSIAAVDHVKGQVMRSEQDPDPNSEDLVYPYDRFKRKTEEIIGDVCSSAENRSVAFTNLRFGAMFSDDPNCIQCSAMQLQVWAAPYLRTRMDCNSGRNVSHCIHQVLVRDTSPSPNPLRPVYYYTRPLHYAGPVFYGDFLVDYRRACNIESYAIWLPNFVVQLFVGVMHTFRTWTSGWLRIPFLESIDYLLQVTREEHTFNLSAIEADFPQLKAKEETIEECFRRRRRLLNYKNLH